MVENQSLIVRKDPTIDQAQRFTPNGVEIEQGEPRRVEPQIPKEREAPTIVMVNRDQNADVIIHQFRKDEVGEGNNLAPMVERIIA